MRAFSRTDATTPIRRQIRYNNRWDYRWDEVPTECKFTRKPSRSPWELIISIFSHSLHGHREIARRYQHYDVSGSSCEKDADPSEILPARDDGTTIYLHWLWNWSFNRWDPKKSHHPSQFFNEFLCFQFTMCWREKLSIRIVPIRILCVMWPGIRSETKSWPVHGIVVFACIRISCRSDPTWNDASARPIVCRRTNPIRMATIRDHRQDVPDAWHCVAKLKNWTD